MVESLSRRGKIDRGRGGVGGGGRENIISFFFLPVIHKMAGSISILDANLLWVFNLLAAISLPPPTI